MAEKVVINSSRVVQEVSIISQPNITKVYINNQNGGGGSITGQNNTWREVFLGYYSTRTELGNLFNQELIVSETENVMILVAFIDPFIIQPPLITRYKFARGKGTWNPIPNVLGTDILFESETPPSSGDIEIITGGPNTQTYDLGDITGTDIWDFVTANGPYDMSNPSLTYLFLSVTDGVIYLHQFVGANGIYGTGEDPAVESDFLLITTNETAPVTFNLKVNQTGDTPLEFTNQIEFDGATVASDGPNKVKVTITGGGGGSSWTVVSSNQTAVNDAQYSNAANATYTDPSPVEGKGYVVKVVNGTATIGGVGYTEGKIVTRTYHSGSWRSKSYVDETIVGSATQTEIDSLQSQIDTIDFNLGDVIAREMIENALTWMLPAFNGIGAAGYQSNIRANTNPTFFGSQDNTAFGFGIVGFRTGTGGGTISGVRSMTGLSIRSFNGVDIIRDFRVNAAATSASRYTVGWSQQFNAANPTNNDQLGHLNCIYVAKLSTSDNLHIVHNDNTGTATSIDLGSSFSGIDPQYKYRMFLRKTGSADYTIQVFRTTLATGAVLASTAYNLTTDLPDLTADLNQIFYVTDNGTGVDMYLGDYGLILKRTPL